MPHMSRCSGRHAKTTSGYEARHAKPGMPGPAALVGTAVKAVPASLVAGAAGSALVLSGAASAATAVPAGLVNSGAADLVAVKAAIPRTVASRVHHTGHRSAYTVISGDTLSGISARFCGTAADYLSLAAASRMADPNAIYPGQAIRLACHAAPLATPAVASTVTGGNSNANSGAQVASGSHHSAAPDSPDRAPGRHAPPGRHARPPAARNRK